MNDSIETDKAPFHFWVVSVLGLLWDMGGAFDFCMTVTRNEDYIAQFTPEQLSFVEGMASWQIGVWAVAIFGSILGCIMLLMRKRAANAMLLVAFLAMLISTVYNFAFAGAMDVYGEPILLAMTGAIFVIALGLWRYAAAMLCRGILV